MDLQEHLDEIDPFVTEADWDALEAAAQKLAAETGGAALARRIAEVDMGDFAADLDDALAEAIERANDSGAGAIYFEYDPDDEWQGTFYLCPDYAPAEEGDDGWAIEWDDDVEGPAIPDFHMIYSELGWDGTDEAIAASFFMIARTVAAVGRAVDRVANPPCAVCVGYREQEPLVRIHEQGPA